MPANWSIRACTVEASRVRMRSTPEEARLLAMALPLEVNSSVICRRRVCTDTYQVTAASGIKTAARNRMIFVRRPTRAVPVFMARSSRPDRRRPVGDRDPPLSVHAGEIDAVETLVPVGAERQRRPDAQVEVLERLERLAVADAGEVESRPPQALHDNLGIDVALEADEAVALDRILVVLERGRHRRVVLLHHGPVLRDPRQRHVVVARHFLRVDQRPPVISTDP